MSHKKKSVGLSYLLWFCLGGVGFHRIYNGRRFTAFAIQCFNILGVVMLIAGGRGFGALMLVIGIGWVAVDAFLIPGWVSAYNSGGSTIAKTVGQHKVNWAEVGRISAWGAINPQLICPHCAVRGYVRNKPYRETAGISGGKAIGGMLTGGVSLLATGLSRHQWVTQAHCGHCTSTWRY